MHKVIDSTFTFKELHAARKQGYTVLSCPALGIEFRACTGRSMYYRKRSNPEEQGDAS